VGILRTPQGAVVTVPDDQVEHAIAAGYSPISVEQAAQTTAAPVAPDQSGIIGGITSGVAGGLSGLTLGASDVALRGLLDPGQLEQLQAAREQHPNLQVAGQLGGALAGGLAAPGSLLARSPAGLASGLGRSVAALGEGAGVVGRTAAIAGAGAAEGALQNAGAYVSDVALGDRKLSADAFVGALGQGALWGGVGAGGLSLAGEGLARIRGALGGEPQTVAARALFPKQDMARGAIDDVQRSSARVISDAVDDGAQLDHVVENAIRERTDLRVATDPEFAARMQALQATPDELEGLMTGLKAPEVGMPGGRIEGHDAELESLLKGLQAPEFGEIGAEIPKRVPEQATSVGRRRPAAVEAPSVEQSTAVGRKPAPAARDVPDYDSLKARLTKSGQDWEESTIPASALAEHGYYEPPGGHADQLRNAKARQAIEEGQREPVSLLVSPSGKVQVEGGRHRIAAAIELDKPIKVKWSTGAEPAEHDVLRGAPPRTPDKVGGPGDLMALLGGAPKAATAASNDLESLLAGTKSLLDKGETLTSVGRMGRQSRVTAELAKSDPQVSSLADAQNELRDARANMERWLGKYDEQMDAELAAGGPGGIAWKEPAALPEDKVQAALERRDPNLSEEIVRAAPAISRYEAAQAALVEEAQKQGLKVPEAAIARAEAFREAQRRATSTAHDQVAQMSAAVDASGGHLALGGQTPIERAAALTDRAGSILSSEDVLPGAANKGASVDKTIVDKGIAGRAREAQVADRTVVEPGLGARIKEEHAIGAIAAPAKPGVGSALGNAGAIYEALRMMGVPLPNPHDIPVIGPVLSAYLKAKILGKAFGRFGGRIGASAETAIAGKAAQVTQRVYSAVDRMLGLGERAVRAAAPKAGGVAAILGHKLFDGGYPDESMKPEPKSGELGEMYRRRASELAAAVQPGAMARAVRGRIHTADPELVQMISDNLEKQVNFLLDKMPKPPMHAGILPGVIEWSPSRSAMYEWSRYVRAASDPAGVLEDAAAGQGLTPQAAETIRTLYPNLWSAAQRRLIERSSEAKPISSGMRQQLSMLFRLPTDPTSTPEYAAWAQEAYQPPQPATPPMAPLKLTAPVPLATMTSGDRP